METKELVQRYFEAGERDDLEAWDEICSAEMVLDAGMGDPIRGLGGVKTFTARFHSAFSEMFLTIHDLIAEGDCAAARWTSGGVHSGPLMSPGGEIPATGKRVAMNGMSFLRVANGRIIEERVQADIMGMMQQLGVAG